MARRTAPMRLPAPQKGGCGGPGPGQGYGKTLVVYFSAGGHAKNVANYIAKATNGDVMELKPAQDYTEADLDYNNRDSRVYREHDDASLRDIPLVKDKADNWGATIRSSSDILSGGESLPGW